MALSGDGRRRPAPFHRYGKLKDQGPGDPASQIALVGVLVRLFALCHRGTSRAAPRPERTRRSSASWLMRAAILAVPKGKMIGTIRAEWITARGESDR